MWSLKVFWWSFARVNAYKLGFREGFMTSEYELMLEEAYEDVQPIEECCRFEVLKVKGHHEGVRTIVTNFSQIVSCLRRSPEHLLKFLTKELASSAELTGDRLVLSRKLPSKEINDKIEKYVARFVLCPKCKKPDTELVCDEGTSFLRCLACGSRNAIH